MGSIIGWLVGRRIFGQVIGDKGARLIAYAGLALLILAALGAAKCAYDRNLIRNHEAEMRARTAEADRRADATAAEQRRKDDSRLSAERAEIKEAITNATANGTDARAAYYRCIGLQQAARASGQPPADC